MSAFKTTFSGSMGCLFAVLVIVGAVAVGIGGCTAAVGTFTSFLVDEIRSDFK